ncbi:MAG: amidohydrolase, partial [Oscillospiraceae bacterium]|nr:amidohydrolase [Oscillospiraceae bacterium]
TQPHLIPCHNIISNIVYAASGHDVCMTMVRGKILYSAGKYHTINLKEVMKELGSYVMPQIYAEK